MAVSFTQTSEAELWELIIDLNIQKGAIYSGENLVITGKVVDHAYKPIRGAEVLIRAGSDTTKAFTDPWGVFRAEFQNFERVPGTYTVNVVASWYGMTGLSTTQFQVKGEVSKISILQEQLSTEHAIKYLSAKESDFEKDPIGQTLFKYYHGLLDELIIENKKAREPLTEQIHLEQQRKIADELRGQAIEEFGPGAGVFQGYRYEDYVNNLNPEIKELVISQLDFTKNIFEEAQKVRETILENGGTYEEARQAYLDMISIPKEIIEQFNEEKLKKSEESNISEENSQQ
ncbi:MAG: carboxypeptidase-like regulatory domain-containing protein [Nitrosopumilus sp.]